MQPTSAYVRQLRSGGECRCRIWNGVIVRAESLPLAADAPVVRQSRIGVPSLIERGPEAVHKLAAGLWRSARENRWTRAAKLSFHWRPRSDQDTSRLRRHLGERINSDPWIPPEQTLVRLMSEPRHS